jgi:hypothetical protein
MRVVSATSPAIATLLALVTACGREPVAPVATETAAPYAIPSDLLITLERTWCLGTCPIYEVSIDAQGRVAWRGQDYVDLPGEQSAQIPLDRVRELLARFEAIDFDALHDSYDVAVTDIPGAFISLRRNATSKRVFVRGGDEVQERDVWIVVSDPTDDPNEVIAWGDDSYEAEQHAKYASTFEALDQLAVDIDRVAGTARWIGDTPKKHHR